MSALIKLAERLDRVKAEPKLLFGLVAGEGWVTSASEETIRTLCDCWNNRHAIAIALRARAAVDGGGE